MMTNDSRGYSYSFVKEVQAADPASLGVKLGLYCIEKNISVEEVSKQLNVSRHSIYNWFRGKFQPSSKQVDKIEAFIGVSQTEDTAV
jgi:transcriptional regulator with XRE-family HTH domain